MNNVGLILIICHITFLNADPRLFLVEQNSSGKPEFFLVDTQSVENDKLTEKDPDSGNVKAKVPIFSDYVIPAGTKKDRLQQKRGNTRRSSFDYNGEKGSPPPKDITIILKLGYEDSFLKKMKGSHKKAKEYIKKILLPTRKYFLMDPLPIKIHLKYFFKYFHGHTYTVNEDNLEEIKELQSDDSKNPLIMWVAQKIDGQEDFGVSTQDGACQYNEGAALVAWYPKNYVLEKHLAHKIGHLLGMQHEGQETFGNSCKKERQKGATIMANPIDTDLPARWSECNGDQLLKWYNRWGEHCYK